MDLQQKTIEKKVFLSADKITADNLKTDEEKALNYKIIHGEALIDEVVDGNVPVKGQFSNTLPTIESRMTFLEQVIKDGLANIDTTQGNISEAKKEYTALKALMDS